MCGILGIIAARGRFTQAQVKDALDTIAHRGPDDQGILRCDSSEALDVWLGHRRLAVLDLSPAGHQPMYISMPQQRQGAIVFNGEIYNYTDLLRDLMAQTDWRPRSRSDTEVLLAGLLLNGGEFLRQTNGMLALACVDQQRNVLILARDRLGKKPLYIYQSEGILAFASELKPFRKLGLSLEVDEEALAYYRWLGYVPANRTIYRQCSKFPAASYAEISLQMDQLNSVTPKLYWDPLSGYGARYKRTYTQAIDEFLSLLDDAVAIRLNADVPVGVFLSGGIDSSLVASSIAKIQPERMTAFTVEFDDPVFDEAVIARATAQELGINIRVLPLSTADFQRQVRRIPDHFDEPFADSSQIPTMAIAEMARRDVVVVLTGDGGDEVFLGYPRFAFPEKLRWATTLSRAIPGFASAATSLLDTRFGRAFIKHTLLITGGNLTNLDGKLLRLKEVLKSTGDAQVYDAIMSVHMRGRNGVASGFSLSDLARKWYPEYGWEGLATRSTREQFAALDLVTYMRDDVLVKVDRGTMAYAIEARSPLLDYRMIEFGTSLPLDFKIFGGRPKGLIRDALATRLRSSLTSLGKKGFGVPLPGDLPPGPTAGIRWSSFIEAQWLDHYSGSSVKSLAKSS